MTRHRMNRTLQRVTIALGAILVVALAAKLAVHVPGVAGTPFEPLAKDIYLYLKEMSPILITVVAAGLVSAFRRRSRFVESLEEEWRNIVRTKSALYAYFEKPYPSSDDYIATFAKLSETIDTMRIVYRNVGETKDLIGLYPYGPLHDMRRILQAMDPRLKTNFSAGERKLAQDAITQCFSAIRENFLEELDLDEPHHPLLISGGRRLKAAGHAPRAGARLARQREAQNKVACSNPEVDAFIGRLYAAEAVAAAGDTNTGANGQTRGRDV
jgi:hypothetical protein